MNRYPSLLQRRLSRIALTLIVLASITGWTTHAEAPEIGLIYTAQQLLRFEEDGYDARRTYRAAIEKAGGTVVVLGQTHPPAKTAARLAGLNGIVLPGGIDVEPIFYNEAHDPHLETVDASLDQFEFRVLDHATRATLPVLGICRGHQLMNVYFGGSLIQDIPTGYESDVEVIHRRRNRLADWPTHAISITPGTILHDLFGEERIQVNTSHHQAVKKLAAGFIVSARSDDGIIEAIEHTGNVFMLGLQFHPERMIDDAPQFQALFNRFVDEARRSRIKQTTLSIRD